MEGLIHFPSQSLTGVTLRGTRKRLGALGWVFGCLAFTLGMGIPPMIHAAEPLRLGGISQSDTTLTPRLRAFFAEIGESIGRPIEIVDGPMLRIERDVEDGRLDGFAYRAPSIESRPVGKVMMRIPVSITSAHFAAYTLDSTLPCLSGWASLQHIEGSFALTRGYSVNDAYLDSLDLRSRVVWSDSLGQSLQLLAARRVKLVVESFSLCEARIRTERAPSGMRYAGSLSELPVYIYLRKNETAIAERIADFLLARQASGPWPPTLTYASPFSNPKGCALNLTQVGVP